MIIAWAASKCGGLFVLVPPGKLGSRPGTFFQPSLGGKSYCQAYQRERGYKEKPTSAGSIKTAWRSMYDSSAYSSRKEGGRGSLTKTFPIFFFCFSLLLGP